MNCAVDPARGRPAQGAARTAGKAG